MDQLMKKSFDFSRFAFKEDSEPDGEVSSVSDQKPKIVSKPAPFYPSDDEQSNDTDFKTRSGRRVQPKTVLIDDSSEASSEEENGDAFKVSAYTNKRLVAKPKRVKKIKEELDLSKEFVPLRSTNKSITVDNPLKSINNKLSNYGITNERKALSDEINLLLEEDDTSSTQSSNKRKANK